MKLFLILAIRFYQIFIRPVIGFHCRFHPHCSAYGIEAISKHGSIKGSYLLTKRLLRCHPWNEGGHDAVP